MSFHATQRNPCHSLPNLKQECSQSKIIYFNGFTKHINFSNQVNNDSIQNDSKHFINSIGKDVMRNLTGFYFAVDGSLTIYELKTFGKS